MAHPASLHGRVGRLAMKELRETLRDRRTIMTLVLMPVLLYPLLSLGFQRFLLTQKLPEGNLYRIGITTEADVPLIQTVMALGDELAEREATRNQTKLTDSGELLVTPDFEQAFRKHQIDIGLRVVKYVRPKPNTPIEPIEFELITSGAGGPAETYLRDRLARANQNLLLNQLRSMGVRQRLPIRIQSRVVQAGPGGVSLTSLIPIVLVLMTITGAVYPSIDLTAGERERNTLELLVAAPIPKLGLLLAKYVAVVTVAFLTAALNLVSMTVTLQATGMGPLVWGERGLSLVSAGLIFLLLALFAAFFSAVLLCITSFARSFKEAQAYLVPLMLLSISPGLVTLLPDISLAGPMAVVPLLNVTLLARDLLAGHANLTAGLIVVGTTVLYGAAALGLASRIFGADAVLYDARAGWGDLWERPAVVRPAPPLGSALLCLALLFPLTFLAAGFVAQQTGWTIESRLTSNSIAAGILFALIPTAYALWQRLRIRDVFFLRTPTATSLPAAILLGLSLWLWAHEIVVLSMRAGLVTLTPEQLERGREIIEQLRKAPFGLVLMSLSLVPAISEEWLFRGFVFSALRQRLSPWAAVFASGGLFGLFHLVATDSLAIERFLPSAFLGCILAWVCWRSGSILPGMVLHILHNGVNLALVRFKEELQQSGWIPSELLQDQSVPGHVPWPWLAGSAVCVAVGLGLLWIGSRPSDKAATLQ